MTAHNGINENQSGFTLIELLVTVSILSILSGLAIAAFTVYRENAEYTKGAATLRNARTAMDVGELELPDDFSLAYTTTGTSGGDLPGVLSTTMPGISTPIDVRLGAEVNACDSSSNPLDRRELIVVESCKSTQSVRWQKFCGGVEVLLEHVNTPTPCS